MDDEQDERDYAAKVEVMGERYMPLMLARLEKLAVALRAAGWEEVKPAYEMSDDQYSAWLSIAGDRAFDVTITLEEARSYGDDLGGVGFGLDIVEYGGLLIGGVRPYNYTPEVWVPVDDEGAVAERWAFIDEVDDAETVDYIGRHYAEKAN